MEVGRAVVIGRKERRDGTGVIHTATKRTSSIIVDADGYGYFLERHLSVTLILLVYGTRQFRIPPIASAA